MTLIKCQTITMAFVFVVFQFQAKQIMYFLDILLTSAESLQPAVLGTQNTAHCYLVHIYNIMYGHVVRRPYE